MNHIQMSVNDNQYQIIVTYPVVKDEQLQGLDSASPAKAAFDRSSAQIWDPCQAFTMTFSNKTAIPSHESLAHGLLPLHL